MTLIELYLFVFKITENYTVFIIKMIRKKKIRIISQFFTCKDKINESNAEVTTHYWIICLYSKNVSFYISIFNKFFNFFKNMLSAEAIEINNFISLQNKAIQCVPVSAYSSRFITYSQSFIFLGKLSLENAPLNLGSFS